MEVVDGIAGPTRIGGQDMSCAMSAVLLGRVRRERGERGVEQLLRAAGTTRSVADLSDLGSWIGVDEALALWRAGVELLDDPELPRRIGAEVVSHLGGSGTSSALRALGSPEALLRHMPVVSKRFSAVADLEAAEVRPGAAVVHMTAAPGHEAHADHCAWTTGMLTQTTALFGLAPAHVEHGPCQLDGAERCTFRLSWPTGAAFATDDAARAASLARQLDAMGARLQDVFDTAADLIGPGDLDETLARITQRASLQVRAAGYLLAVHGAEGAVHTHEKGLTAEEAAAVAARVLDEGAAAPPEHWLVVEVRSERHHYGALVAVQQPGGRFLPQERGLLEVYARYAAAALDTATALAEAHRGRAEAQRRDEESRTLLRLARSLAGAVSSVQVAQRLADAIPGVVDCDRVSVYLWSDADQELQRVAMNVTDPAVASSEGVTSFPAANAQLAAWLRQPDPAPIFIDARPEGVRERFGDLDVVAAVAVPIATPQHLLGTFVATVARNPERLADGPELLDRLSGVAAHAITALENGRLVDQITHQATHDGLTGVANRAGFASRMTDATRAAQTEGRAFTVFYVDLDAFKPINDAHGHEVGDDLLRAVAQRLQACLRPTDVVARLGGDEFAVLVDDDGSADIAGVGRRLQAAFEDPFRLGGHALTIGASIGRATWPDDGRVPEELLRAADGAMYGAKRRRVAAGTGPVA